MVIGNIKSCEKYYPLNKVGFGGISMKKIGKEVLFLDAKEGNPRNGEGSFLRIDEHTIVCLFKIRRK